MLVLVFIAPCSPLLVQSPAPWLTNVWIGQWRVLPRFLPELRFCDFYAELRVHRRPVDLFAEESEVGAFGQLSQGRTHARGVARMAGFAAQQQDERAGIGVLEREPSVDPA